MEKVLLHTAEPAQLTRGEQNGGTDGAGSCGGAARPSSGRATGGSPGQVQRGRSRALLSAEEEEEEGKERSGEGAISVSLSVL